ncbi:hypothetical protein KCP78_18840 [Salmonella enterica subsp. enterica]|nr:hypothetical protein KCP78_18840 [Salmonella enterica subsp. enterica]
MRIDTITLCSTSLLAAVGRSERHQRFSCCHSHPAQADEMDSRFTVLITCGLWVVTINWIVEMRCAKTGYLCCC